MLHDPTRSEPPLVYLTPLLWRFVLLTELLRGTKPILKKFNAQMGGGAPGGRGDVEASIDGRVTFHIRSRVRLGTG